MKITFSDPEYYIQQKNQVVVCKISGGIPQLQDTAGGTGVIIDGVGISRCHTKDNFNLEVGKRLAERRAKVFIYNKVLEYSKNVLSDLNTYKTELETFVDNIKGYKKASKTYVEVIKSLDNPEEIIGMPKEKYSKLSGQVKKIFK